MSAAPSSPSPLRGPFRPPILLDHGLLLSAVMMLFGRFVEAVDMLPSLSSGSHNRLARKSVHPLLKRGFVGKRRDSRQLRLAYCMSVERSSTLGAARKISHLLPSLVSRTRDKRREPIQAFECCRTGDQDLCDAISRPRSTLPMQPRLHQSHVKP